MNEPPIASPLPEGTAPPPLPAPGPVLRGRLRAIVEIVMVSVGAAILAESLFLVIGLGGEIAVLGTRRLVALLLLQNAFSLGMIVLFLRVEGHGLRHLGYHVRGAATEILLGISLFPVILFLGAWFRLGVRRFLPGLITVEENPLLGLLAGPEDVVLFVLLSILAGGVGEETVRAFVLRRFESHLGGMGVGLVAWSALFGAMHWIQGADTAVTVGFIGLLLGLIYAWRRNPLAPLAAHAAFNVAQTLLAYFLAPA